MTYDIAVIGGTGPQGKGLAYRWAKAGHRIVIGSRAAEKYASTRRSTNITAPPCRAKLSRGASPQGQAL